MIFLGFYIGSSRDVITVSNGGKMKTIHKSEYPDQELYGAVEDIIINSKVQGFKLKNFLDESEIYLEVNLETSKEYIKGDYAEFDYEEFSVPAKNALFAFFSGIATEIGIN